nr:non-classical export protein 2 like 1 [Quercus suber]
MDDDSARHTSDSAMLCRKPGISSAAHHNHRRLRVLYPVGRTGLEQHDSSTQTRPLPLRRLVRRYVTGLEFLASPRGPHTDHFLPRCLYYPHHHPPPICFSPPVDLILAPILICILSSSCHYFCSSSLARPGSFDRISHTPHLNLCALFHTTYAKMSIINLALRGFQFIWTLLVMALIGNMIADSNGHNASIVNYSLFVSIWGMLTLLYLIPASIKDSFQIHAMIPLVLDVLNVIFWFCGAVALAAELGAHSCGNSVSWPQAASPPFTRPAVADRIITGLPQQQQGHRWLQQALPRGSGLLRLPLVRIRRVLSSSWR